MNNTSIAFLKAEANESDSDPYVKIVKSEGMKASVIPTLAFNFINENLLHKHLMRSDHFIGLILTSTRAVEAVHKVFSAMPDNMVSKWREKDNYCIGESTSTLARTLMQFNPLGEESGNSEQLCSFILSSSNKYNQDSRSFLFPSSHRRKETVPSILEKNGINMIEIVCYETVCNPSLKEYWDKMVSDQGLPNILVFFSPSGVEFSHELVKDYYSITGLPKCVAIGPSTAKALNDADLPPCKIASKPNPGAVYEAIKEILNEPEI